MTAVVLIASGLTLAAALAGIAALGDLTRVTPAFLGLFVVASAAYGVAVGRVLRQPDVGPASLAGIVLGTVLFRALLLPTEPTLSTDVYRYLWDGRLAVAGVNPYRYPANAPELAGLRDDAVYPRLNHPDWRTIYPPGAQLLFEAVARLAPGRASVFKGLMVAVDLLTFGLLIGWLRTLGRPPAWALIYGWHPLVAVEVAGSGHLDAVALAATVGALWATAGGREASAGALLAAGGLVKLYPLLLLPVVWRNRPVRTLAAAVAVLAAGYLLYPGEGLEVLGSLSRYLAEEHFNPGVPAALDWLLGGLTPAARLAARGLPLVALAGLALALGVRGRDVPACRRAVWLVGAYLLLAPNLFPWYALWLVPLLAAVPAWPWLYLTCAVALSYAAFAQPVWSIPAWVTAAEFAPLAVSLVVTGWTRKSVAGWRASGLAP